ncbi:MAG TPA: hypothetical protein VH480_18415 [Streptosporangiaceae bacterium]
MLEDEAEYGPLPDQTILDEIPAPDPGVVDDARLRLAARRALAMGRDPDGMAAQPAEDLRAVSAVLHEAIPPADAIDVGAGLVVLSELRLHLDRLETGLLDLAQQVDLGWDVIAAILGIPAERARYRHARLQARRDA